MTARKLIVDTKGLQQLFDLLRKRGYHLIGPTVREGAIVYDNITALADLPVGWIDEQDGGACRLKRSNDERVFGYTVGPQSWKRLLFPPMARLWQANRGAKKIQAVSEKEGPTEKYAFIGARSCEIHAIAIQDKVFLEGEYSDPGYRARRENTFVLAANCSHASSNCFCVSMGTGPKATFGYDLALTEVLENGSHFFVLDVGSERGNSVIESITNQTATEAQSRAADHVSDAVEVRKTLDTNGIKELLYRNYDNPRWIQVADRCLTCGNCTLVCPTCFCSDVYDVTDLTGRHAERWRKWDSCFTVDFSYIHGGSIRPSPMSRYRQWMTHKLGTWIDQFGTSGCVGCGRCITWCPVGIDITEEARAIRESEKTATAESGGMKIENA
ncbi:MAG: 4Fe-4S dicluster domain-containing protein [Candidatus Bathyarchaeia archaeon]|jgi:ferredoxin